ncbi:MAG TPA: SurA N-terminal domain-containing protein, partial [Candidatus Kapabacteria bacterium]|nr:SurA N-terminal domain-containing protein [Candidatus Kapabacteria bacterium]
MTIRKLLVLSSFVFAALIAITPPLIFAQKTKSHPQKKVTQVAPLHNHLPGDTVGVVNGDVITYADFNSIMSGYLKLFVQRSGDNVVTDSLYSVIVDSAWNKAVTDILTEQEIQKRKLEM